MPHALEHASLLRERVLKGVDVGRVLRFGLRVGLGRVVALARKRAACELRVDPPQCEALGVIVGGERPAVGIRKH